jgi:signal transduction histidine kinase
LGLAIAKWAVEVNGGSLTLDPSNGEGSCFRIMLPQTGTGSAADYADYADGASRVINAPSA